MSTPALKEPQPPQGKDQSLASTGFAISLIGLVGWALMLIAILAVPKENYSGDGQRDLVIGFGNFMGYLLQVVIGLFGLSINGTLSIVGTALSLTAVNHSAAPKAKTGLALGITGLGIGFFVVIWRMAAWGVFSA